MPNIALSPPSELECVLKPRRYGAPTDEPGVILAPLSDLSLSSIIVRNGKTEELRRRAKERLGIELPMTPRRQISGALSLIWAGSGRWLAATSKATPLALEQRLGEAFLGVASVTNQSDGRSIVRIRGPKARKALAKGVPIDLDPAQFAVDGAALTIVAHINVHFWQVDAAPTYDFAVFRSFSVSFCEWLIEAAAEYGVAILPRLD